MAPHIELDRRFLQVSPEKNPEQAAIESYTAVLSGGDSGLSWDDLLKKSRVVVLGEPGSGKTAEFREMARVKNQGKGLAFFISLERLINETLDSVLSTTDSRKLQRWLSRGTSHAVFFLDSVDESKRRIEKDFLKALERFANEISAGLGRCTIIISSRITEWRPTTDTGEFERLLPTNRKQDSADEHL